MQSSIGFYTPILLVSRVGKLLAWSSGIPRRKMSDCYYAVEEAGMNKQLVLTDNGTPGIHTHLLSFQRLGERGYI